MTIHDNVQSLLGSLPQHVKLEAAAKTQSLDAVKQAIQAGVHVIGENYVQEMVPVYKAFSGHIPIHFIGHLQTNKVKTAVEHCDMIETVDSMKLAKEISKRSRQLDKIMPILIEINSGREQQKHGVFPEEADALIREVSLLPNLSIQGLMTMGPWSEDRSLIREAFQTTKSLFDTMAAKDIPNVKMKILSMGMTHSYPLAIEEGANMIRIGTKIFGERVYHS